MLAFSCSAFYNPRNLWKCSVQFRGTRRLVSTNCIPLKNRFLFLLFHRQVVYGFFHLSIIWLRIFLNVLKLMFYLNLDYVLRLNTPSCARDQPSRRVCYVSVENKRCVGKIICWGLNVLFEYIYLILEYIYVIRWLKYCGKFRSKI